jgi:CheY-like chemotaxis protein
MGGRIGATSEIGVGSTFHFTVPFGPGEADVRAPVPATELGGLHVLIVDDNATNRRIFEAYVASWGMRPEVADGASAALAQLHRAAQAADPYDIALLDYNMPEENGLELARQITASPALRQTRLILLTSSSQIAADDATTGIRHHLTKPVRQSRLLDAITAAMAIDAEAPPDEAAAEPPRSQVPAGCRILVAEDQHVNWKLIERTLAKRGHVPVNATNGSRAIEMLEAEPYDLVLMDCQMPVLDGYDASREIRRREATEQRAAIPIVAMTANAMLGDREKCLAAGMDDYLPKPISPDELDEMLARWLPGTPRDRPLLDQARLRALRSVFASDELPGVLNELATTISSELERVNEAVVDHVTLIAATHRLKNNAGMIGASKLADAAARLESQAAQARSSHAAYDEAVVQTLFDHWDAARDALDRELEEIVGEPAG